MAASSRKFGNTCGIVRLYGLVCLFIYLFSDESWSGNHCRGENEAFSKLSGLDISRIRLIAIIVSTVIAGFGICVYSQSYGFIQLYDEPLSMAFPAIWQF